MHFFCFGVASRRLAPQRFYPRLCDPSCGPGRLGPAARAWKDAEATRADKKAPPFWGGAKKNAARRRLREASRVLSLLARVATAQAVTRPQHLVRSIASLSPRPAPLAWPGAARAFQQPLAYWGCPWLPARAAAAAAPPRTRPLRRAKIAGGRLLEPIKGNDDRDAHQQKD